MPSTRVRILDAAEELFAARGYAATSTRLLAERAAVNEVTLFRQFGSKAGILAALGQRVAEQSARTVDFARLAGLDLAEALWELARVEVASAQRFGALVLRLVIEARVQPEVASALETGAVGNQQAVAQLIAQRQHRSELRGDLTPQLLTEGFFALTSSLVMARFLAGPPTALDAPGLDELASHVVSLFLAGAGPRPEPDPANPQQAPHHPGKRRSP